MIKATDEKELRKESVKVKKQRIKNATAEKALRKELAEVTRQSIIDTADEQSLGKGSKVNLQPLPKNDKTKDDMQQQYVEEGKVDFKIDSEINSDTEKEKKKYPETGKIFLSRIKKVIKIEYESLPEKVTRTIYLKESLWEKKFINSESSKEEALRKNNPVWSNKTESKRVNLVNEKQKKQNQKE